MESERKETYLLATLDTDAGQFLVEVFPDGQVHLAQRSDRHQTWSPGWWTIGRDVPFGDICQSS
jgi:hypothetical protein